jgi:hypothetical protein
MKKLLLISFAATIAAYTACQKKDGTPVQPDKIAIDIKSPNNGSTFEKGDTLYINADVSYPSQLHAYEVSIKNNNTNDVVFDEYQHVYTDKFSINTSWVDSLQEETDLTMQVIVQIDHDGHQSIKELSLHSKPQ